MRNTYTSEFKAKVVREVRRAAETLSQVAAGHGLHPNLVTQWHDQVLAGLSSLFSRTKAKEWAEKAAANEHEKQDLYAEIGRLTTPPSWLKKSQRDAEQSGMASTNRRAGCRSIGDGSVRTGGVELVWGYYQAQADTTRELDIKGRIDEVQTAYPFYGIRCITAQLQADGLLVNHKAVARHRGDMGLPAISPSPNTSKRAHQHAIYPYLLRDLTITQPTHVWGVDITCIRLRSGWVYLYAVLDWYSRFVVSWTLDVTLDMGFVLAAIRTALSLATPTICNSDQDRHFSSPFYTDLLRDAHVHLSMDGKGRALNNLFTERLWRTVKYEEVYLKKYASPNDAHRSLTDYFESTIPNTFTSHLPPKP